MYTGAFLCQSNTFETFFDTGIFNTQHIFIPVFSNVLKYKTRRWKG